MVTMNGPKTTWKVSSRHTDHQWTGEIVAYWEASLNPVSHDYTPDEISAGDLFDRWVGRVHPSTPTGWSRSAGSWCATATAS